MYDICSYDWQQVSTNILHISEMQCDNVINSLTNSECVILHILNGSLITEAFYNQQKVSDTTDPPAMQSYHFISHPQPATSE